MHFLNAHLSADPVHIPGPETGTIDVQVLKPIAGQHFDLKVTISKKVLFGFVPVPCISEIGSWYGLFYQYCFHFCTVFNILFVSCRFFVKSCFILLRFDLIDK